MDEDDGNKRKRRKRRSPYYKADNAGGYGNPPVKGQRKKGDKGGPGRPKGQTSLEAALGRIFKKKRAVVRDGKLEMLHPSVILAERILEALLGKNLSPQMIDLARKLMEEFGPQMPGEPAPWDLSGFSNDEATILSGLINRGTSSPPGEATTTVLGRVIEPFPRGEFRIFRRDDGYIGLERVLSDGDCATAGPQDAES